MRTSGIQTRKRRSSVAAVPACGTTDRWIRGAGTPYPVIDLLVADGWSFVLDARADMHCASPDGRAYLGYLPESAWPHPGDVWHLSVESGNGLPGWEQTFHRDAPAEAIAGFVNALLTLAPRFDVEPF